MLANVALHGPGEKPPGCPRTAVDDTNGVRPGAESLPNGRLVRYADLCRIRHKSAYADRRIMPTAA